MDDQLEQLLIAGVILFFILPPIWVLLSGRSHGGAKFGWLLVTLFFSWLGLAVFLIVTQALENRQRKKSSVTTGFQVSTALFLISLILWWRIRPDLEWEFPPTFLEKLGYWILLFLTWPMGTLNLPLWTLPIINVVQGFVLVFLVKLFIKIMARKNVAALGVRL